MNNLLIIVSIVAYGIGALFYKIASNYTHPIMTATIMVGLYLVQLPIAFSLFKVNFGTSSAGFWFSLIAGGCTCIGSLSYMFALRGTGAGQLAAIVSVSPVITILLSVFFLGEEFSIKKIIGCVMAVGSVFLLTMK